MLILGYLLLPMVLADPSAYAPEVKNGVLKRIDSIGTPSNSLDLSGLGIKHVDARAFENMNQVKSINLANNNISSLPRSIFSHLPELEYFSIADNAIESLEVGQFNGSNHLEILNISNNPIKELLPGRFHGLGNSTIISASFEHGLSLLHPLVFDFFDDRRSHKSTIRPVTPSPRLHLREILCVRNGILEKLIPFGNTTEPHCKTVTRRHVSHRGSLRLDLDKLGISKFAPSWYALKEDIDILNVENNNITEITVEFLNGLPEGIHHVDLSNNKIERLEKGIIVNGHIQFMNFSNNFISEIEDGALEETKLVVVDLHKNRLNNTRFLKTLPKTVISLILSDNSIDELVPDTFPRFSELDTIDFAGNGITIIKRESLCGLNSVRNLNFARNQIKKIEPGALRNFTTLSSLNLANNELISLDEGAFDGLYLLEYLDLSSNNIQTITHDSFHGLMGAGGLSLWEKPVELMDDVTFRKVQKHRPYLTDDQIRQIENETSGSTILVSLRLRNNSLTQINGDEFAGFNELKLLDLSGNRISKIEKGFAKHLGNVTELNLSDNPIKKLENGALFGIRKRYKSAIRLHNVQLEVLQAGVFNDL